MVANICEYNLIGAIFEVYQYTIYDKRSYPPESMSKRPELDQSLTFSSPVGVVPLGLAQGTLVENNRWFKQWD